MHLNKQHNYFKSYKRVLSEGNTEKGIYKDAKLDWHALDSVEMTELKRPLHQICHLNTLLNKANEGMPEGGYLLCHTRTAVLKRQMIMKSYPWGINYLVFTLHFLWHRVMPKLKLTKIAVLSPGFRLTSSFTQVIRFISPRCATFTPLGRPVEPEV